MKTILIFRITFLSILMMGWMTVKGQEQWEVPGDNFSLEGALEIFKKSGSPEEFERMLNDPESRVNNLDLNGDGYVDYIRVIDMNERNVHTFIIQAAVSEFESQDIAVITLEKLADGRAILQITGDADIYGVETIIEPTSEVRTYAGANRSRVIVNVWAWPMVRYIYGPYYNVWVSPWGWGYRPYWWSPWRPVFYYDYYTFWWPYRSYYSVCHTHRIFYAHSMYWPHRTTSVTVYNNHHHRIREYRSTYIDREGHYQARESRNSSRRSTAARYNSDGRIISDSNIRNNSRSNSQHNINVSRSSTRYENENSIQRSDNTGQRYSGNSNARISAGRSDGDASLRRSDGRSNAQQSTRVSSGTPNMRSSSGSSGIQRSGAGSNYGADYRRSNGNANVQGSSSRTYGNVSVQRSPQGSRSSSNLRQSSGYSNSRNSLNSTSGNSSFRSPSKNPSIGSSSGNRSSIQSAPSRSSGSSNSRSSGNSNSRSSGSSSQGNRGRH